MIFPGLGKYIPQSTTRASNFKFIIKKLIMKTQNALLVVLVFFFACTKTDINSATKNLSAAAENNSTTAKSYFDILTAHKWMYNAFYLNYVDQNHKGDPQYIRGAHNNSSEIIGTDRFAFKTNFHFLQTEGDYAYKGTWKFSEDHAFLIMKYSWGTDEDSILLCNNQHFNYMQRFGYGNKLTSYTELIPAE